MNSDRQETLQRIATAAEVSPDAIRLIYCVFNHLDGNSGLDKSHHITAANLCDGLLAFAKQNYGDGYRHALRTWNLDTSEKLGRAISVLVAHDWVKPTDGDQESDFNGKFDLSETCD